MTLTDTTVATGDVAGYADCTVDQDDMPWVLGHLADIYTLNKDAVIRELAVNGLDSVAAAGTRAPVRVVLPSFAHPSLTVQDFGLGMSIDDLVGTFVKFGKSPKRDQKAAGSDPDAVPVGNMGIGAKSPWSVSDQFLVTAVKDGQKNVVSMIRGENDMPMWKVLASSATDEPNGVLVEVPVKTDDLYQWRKAAERVLRWFDEGSFELSDGDGDQIKVEHWTRFVEADDSVPGRKIMDEDFGAYVKMGPVAYQVPETARPESSSFVQVASIDDFAVSRSRESVQDTQRARKALKDAMVSHRDVLREQTEALFAKTDHADLTKAIKALRSVSRYRSDRVPGVASTLTSFSEKMIESISNPADAFRVRHESSIMGFNWIRLNQLVIATVAQAPIITGVIRYEYSSLEYGESVYDLTVYDEKLARRIVDGSASSVIAGVFDDDTCAVKRPSTVFVIGTWNELSASERRAIRGWLRHNTATTVVIAPSTEMFKKWDPTLEPEVLTIQDMKDDTPRPVRKKTEGPRVYQIADSGSFSSSKIRVHRQELTKEQVLEVMADKGLALTIGSPTELRGAKYDWAADMPHQEGYLRRYLHIIPGARSPEKIADELGVEALTVAQANAAERDRSLGGLSKKELRSYAEALSLHSSLRELKRFAGMLPKGRPAVKAFLRAVEPALANDREIDHRIASNTAFVLSSPLLPEPRAAKAFPLAIRYTGQRSWHADRDTAADVAIMTMIIEAEFAASKKES